LGLSIVHKIVNDNDGRIDVGSAPGRGTKIVVELPR
jgi:signal transduction histidine kinase